ncbi:hypothetical protein HU200_060508 [Digitaria exilis]|uniref:Uncharacterized protein n=1 Tax=Digitaria exilis TaxID=1010633 RepID=A0A835A937_9POAL|nr:hypothetical protein HU200_060508 [Digitaria exilis]
MVSVKRSWPHILRNSVKPISNKRLSLTTCSSTSEPSSSSSIRRAMPRTTRRSRSLIRKITKESMKKLTMN